MSQETQLVEGVHHVTFLTEDMDRLLGFYVRVFDAEVTLDTTEEGMRHAFLKVGPTTVGPDSPIRRCSSGSTGRPSS